MSRGPLAALNSRVWDRLVFGLQRVLKCGSSGLVRYQLRHVALHVCELASGFKLGLALKGTENKVGPMKLPLHPKALKP